MPPLPIGKVPPEALSPLFKHFPSQDPRVRLGPGIGMDCAVIDFGETFLVAKSDPITFTAEDIGWYAVQVNANDIATTGATPRWFLATLLLPAGTTDVESLDQLFQQIGTACTSIGVEVVGGHSEITAGLKRPIVIGTMLGEVAKRGLITPAGARPGNILLLTKGIPIEAASILAREFGRAMKDLPKSVIQKARHYLSDPGISVVREALIAAEFEGVTAMHDPTEGGLASGLWEMAEAAQLGILVDEARIPLLPEGAQLCQHVNINPLHSIASGALLIAVEPQATEPVVEGIRDADIFVTDIGVLTAERGVRMKHGDLHRPLDRPNRDALAALFEADPHIRDQSDDKRQEEGQHGQGGYGEDVDDEKD